MSNASPIPILMVEDDLKLATLVEKYLHDYGYHVQNAKDGAIGLEQAKKLKPELIILDLMMPKLDGLSVCRELQSWYSGKILVLTASDEDMDQVAALEMGADDFVQKPIHPRVLLARIRAVLRRDEPRIDNGDMPSSESTTASDVLTFGQLRLNYKRRQALLSNEDSQLSEAEFELLWFLASHADEALGRDEIMQTIRGIGHDGLDRSIDNRIVNLRKKLHDNQGMPKRIITIRGKGYLFAADGWGE